MQELLAARQDLAELAGLDARSSELTARARDGILRAARDLRDVVTDLHPVVLAHGGLEAAIGAVAGRTARRAGLSYAVSVDPDAAGVQDETVLALVRELLTNVAKHADATHVAVTVSRTDARLALEVVDDGCRADLETVAAAPSQGHIGLASCRERVEALGGSLRVEARSGGGTSARVTLAAGG